MTDPATQSEATSVSTEHSLLFVAVLLLGFVLTVLVGPVATFGVVFLVLAAVDKTALPWLTVFLAPAIVFFALIPFAVKFGKKVIATSRPHDKFGALFRAVVITSVIWAPLAAWKLFIELLQKAGS